MGIHSKSEASRRRLLPCVKKRRRIYFDSFKHREEDGAVKWTEWLPNSQVFSSENVNQWRPRQWVDLIRRGSNEERFENCLNSQSEVRSMRALQGHSGGVRIEPKRQNNVKLPNGWTDCQCKFARWRTIVNTGRRTCFFTAVDPMNEPREVPSNEIDVPRIVPYKTDWRHPEDAVYWFDLPLAHNQGLVFRQTISDANIFNNSMPAKSLVKIIKRKTHEIFCQRARPDSQDT